MIKIRGIHTVLLWGVLIFFSSGYSTVKAEDAAPSANNMEVNFYTGLWGASGRLCSIPIPDNGNAPICPEVLKVVDENSCHISEAWCRDQGKEYVPELGSISFGGWRGVHVVCLQTAQSVDVLCVQGELPDDNRNPKTVAHMKAVRGYPEFLRPLEVTVWKEELLGKITKIRSWMPGR